MEARVTLERAAARIEGPLVFLKRTLEVGLNEAVDSLVRKVVEWHGEDHLQDDVSILAVAVD